LVSADDIGSHGLQAHLALVTFRIDPSILKSARTKVFVDFGRDGLPVTTDSRPDRPAGRDRLSKETIATVSDNGDAQFASYPGEHRVEFVVDGFRPVPRTYSARMGETVDLGLIDFPSGVVIQGLVDVPSLDDLQRKPVVMLLNAADGSNAGAAALDSESRFRIAGLSEGEYVVMLAGEVPLAEAVKVSSRSPNEVITVDFKGGTTGILEIRFTGNIPTDAKDRRLDVLKRQGLRFIPEAHPSYRAYLNRRWGEAFKGSLQYSGIKPKDDWTLTTPPMPPGNYAAIIDQFNAPFVWPVRVVAGQTTKEELEIPGYGTIQGRVTLTDGTPVTDSDVQLALDDPGDLHHPLFQPSQVYPKKDGSFTIKEVFAGSWRVSVRGYRHLQVGTVWYLSRVDVIAGQTATLEIVLPKRERSKVTVDVTIDGKPASGSGLGWSVVSSESRAPSGNDKWRSPVEFTDVECGEVEFSLMVFPGDGIHGVWHSFRQRVTTNVDFNHTSITLTSGALKGQLVDAKPKSLLRECTVVLRQPGLATVAAKAPVSPTGEYAFPNIPNGLYEVAVEARWGALWTGTIHIQGATELPIPMR
jgi:hypothetical protein